MNPLQNEQLVRQLQAQARDDGRRAAERRAAALPPAPARRLASAARARLGYRLVILGWRLLDGALPTREISPAAGPR